MKLSLEDHGLERTLRFELDRRAKWVSIGARGAEINDPDVVTTGEARFDEAITVLAQDGAAPAVKGVFDQAALRAQIAELFKRFPLAGFSGSTLTIPNVAADANVTGAALRLGSQLVLSLRAAIDGVPEIAPEAPPVLEPGLPWWRTLKGGALANTATALMLVVVVYGSSLVGMKLFPELFWLDLCGGLFLGMIVLFAFLLRNIPPPNQNE